MKIEEKMEKEDEAESGHENRRIKVAQAEPADGT